jgi:hypothetical protein
MTGGWVWHISIIPAFVPRQIIFYVFVFGKEKNKYS